MLGLTLPQGMKFSSGFVFEVAIACSVLGSVAYMLDTLGQLSGNEDPAPVSVSSGD